MCFWDFIRSVLLLWYPVNQRIARFLWVLWRRQTEQVAPQYLQASSLAAGIRFRTCRMHKSGIGPSSYHQHALFPSSEWISFVCICSEQHPAPRASVLFRRGRRKTCTRCQQGCYKTHEGFNKVFEQAFEYAPPASWRGHRLFSVTPKCSLHCRKSSADKDRWCLRYLDQQNHAMIVNIQSLSFSTPHSLIACPCTYIQSHPDSLEMAIAWVVRVFALRHRNLALLDTFSRLL